MPSNGDASTQSTLERLLAEHGLDADSRLYREALFSNLHATDSPGVFRLAANPKPADSVVDVYGQGHVVQAEVVGAGLAFAQTTAPNWQETMELRTLRESPGGHHDPHVEVEVRLGDVLAQGGLVYPVESVTVERAWFCTLPAQGIDVRVVQ